MRWLVGFGGEEDSWFLVVAPDAPAARQVWTRMYSERLGRPPGPRRPEVRRVWEGIAA